MTRLLSTALLLLAATPSWATTVTLDLPGNETPDIQKVVYACGKEKVTATYINTNDNQLALVEIGGGTIVMVNVLSGSGAKYVGQQYEWWTKGGDAMLTDLMSSPDPKSCTEA